MEYWVTSYWPDNAWPDLYWPETIPVPPAPVTPGAGGGAGSMIWRLRPERKYDDDVALLLFAAARAGRRLKGRSTNERIYLRVRYR